MWTISLLSGKFVGGLRFKGLFLYTGGVSCVMWSGALDSSGVLLSYHVISPA